jgi:hypothetical protein
MALTPEQQQQKIADLTRYLNTADTNFQQQYGGRSIYWGDDVFKYTDGAFQYAGDIQDIWKTQGTLDNSSMFDPTGGLQPINWKQGWTQTEAFKYMNQGTDTYQAAQATNFSQGPAAPTADQYTGKLGGFTSGGVQLYQLKDGSMTATPPPTGALTGQGVAAGYEASQNKANNASLVAPPDTTEIQAAGVASQIPSGYQLKNPGIATANPGASANENYINALYQEAYGRDATAKELDIYTGRTVADASNIILGQGRSPFATGSTTPLTDAQREGQESYGTDLANSYEPMLNQYGVKPFQTGENPSSTFAEMYKQLLTDMGIPDLKSQLESVNLQFSELQNKLNDEIQEINDNPWLTEGIRLRRIQSLENKYEGKLNILTNQIKLFNSLYEQGLEEARFVAGAAFDQYQFDVNTQIKLAQLAQDQAEAEARLAKLNTQIVDVGGRKLLIDTQTGKTIADLGVSKISGGGGGTSPTIIPEVKLTDAEKKILAGYDQQGFNFLNASMVFQLAFLKTLTATQRNKWIEQYKKDQAVALYSIDPEKHLEEWLNKSEQQTSKSGLDFSNF